MSKNNIIIIIVLILCVTVAGIGIFLRTKISNRRITITKEIPKDIAVLLKKASEKMQNADTQNSVQSQAKKVKECCDLAISYMEKQDYKAAINNLQAAVKIDPQHPKSNYALAVCYARINPPDTVLSRQYLKKAKDLGYNVPDWLNRHLDVLEGRKQ